MKRNLQDKTGLTEIYFLSSSLLLRRDTIPWRRAWELEASSVRTAGLVSTDVHVTMVIEDALPAIRIVAMPDISHDETTALIVGCFHTTHLDRKANADGSVFWCGWMGEAEGWGSGCRSFEEELLEEGGRYEAGIEGSGG